MNILVTGGAGFLGAPLVKKLVEENHQVRVIDNLSRGRRENLDKYLGKIDFNIHDMKKPIHVMADFDIVFDLAARIYGITKLYEDEPAFVNENIRILLNTLESLKFQVKHYFYISSSCVYDFDGCPMPHKEEDAEKVPRSAYDISKRFGEELVKIYAEKYKFKYTIIRPFNVYGPNESEEAPHVITDFYSRILNEKKKPTGRFWILGDGQQTRSFTYVEDFVNAVVFLMNRGETGTFNVGTGEEIRINDLLQTMFKIAGLSWKKYEIEHRTPFKQDVRKRNPAVSKIRGLGWKAKYSLEDGLRRTWDELT